MTNKDYPTLVPEGQPVDTIAAPAVLAVFNWQKGDRYRRVERFVERLFTKWDKFRAPPRHPKCRHRAGLESLGTGGRDVAAHPSKGARRSGGE